MFNDLNHHNDIQKNIEYMTKSHLRNVMQLAIFYTGSEKIYAINISKIESFLIKENVEMVRTPSANGLVEGVLNLRGDMVSIVNLDHWIGEKVENDPYKIIIICNYNEKKIGILAKDIIRIQEMQSSELKVPSSDDPKISYVTEIELLNQNKLCIVFDAEKLLFDLGTSPTASGTTIYDIDSIGDVESIKSEKMVLIAEDSSTVIDKLNEFFTKLEVKFEIYENGQLLIDRLEEIDSNKIGIIVTDLEMPVKNGYQVIKYIKSSNDYKHIPILSLTSMTNRGVYDKVKSLGAMDLINKADLDKLYSYIRENIEGVE
ncbi:MAG: chemotaxis protein CheW [Campylobacterota bacterium]|nr:chemotaxis protein CheW [Campylobacterota bacterium]